MDKQKTIAYLSETEEDQILLARTLDRISSGERRNIVSWTNFLSDREQDLVKKLLEMAGIQNVYFFGGAVQAERCIACYIPEYLEPEQFWLSDDAPVCVLRAMISSYDTPNHRDFMGSILGLGIKREMIGDIYVSESHCDIICMREMAQFLMDHLVAVGRARVRTQTVTLAELVVPEKKVKMIRDTVASLRLDSVISSGFQIGRGKAQDYISAGRVSLNHMVTTKSDSVVEIGNKISIRGLGKMELAEIGGVTKKGRISVVLHRFL